MKKQILNIGKSLDKEDQKKINGGGLGFCYQKGVMCCRDTGTSFGAFCDPGVCTKWGTCIYY